LYDYMRDTFLNLQFKAKGGLDKRGLVKQLNSINEPSYFWK
jgi:hypothetical protein